MNFYENFLFNTFRRYEVKNWLENTSFIGSDGKEIPISQEFGDFLSIPKIFGYQKITKILKRGKERTNREVMSRAKNFNYVP